MTEQSDFSFSSGEPDQERLRSFDADFTPEPVVAQFLGTLRDRGLEPKCILDPAAGAGVFGKVARELWPNASIEAIEPRKEEAQHLERYYDIVHHVEFEEAVRRGLLWCVRGMRPPRFDLIATNPPFSLWRDFVAESMPLIWTGHLALLGLTSWGARSEDGYELFELSPPDRQSRIPGTINFRGPGVNPDSGKKWTADSRDYCWWQWAVVGGRLRDRDPEDRSTMDWKSENLPRLPGHDRRWKTKPGT